MWTGKCLLHRGVSSRFSYPSFRLKLGSWDTWSQKTIQLGGSYTRRIGTSWTIKFLKDYDYIISINLIYILYGKAFTALPISVGK